MKTSIPTLLVCSVVLCGSSARGAPVRLTAKQAVARALQHNLSLAVERQRSALTDGPAVSADATFDPELFA